MEVAQNIYLKYNRPCMIYISTCIVRFLISWYSSQCCSVSWDGASSDSFNVSNGVCQGGVLSPVLFTIYMDILLNKLKECGVS